MHSLYYIPSLVKIETVFRFQTASDLNSKAGVSFSEEQTDLAQPAMQMKLMPQLMEMDLALANMTKASFRLPQSDI